MKRALLLGMILVLSSSACTTVHVVENDRPSAISATVSKARSAIIRTSKTLFAVFSDRNWSRENAGEAQSAANILMQGLKKSRLAESNVDLYIRNVSSLAVVESDIALARRHVETLTVQAVNLLSENPDLADVRIELKTLEQALIASRQAELTFQTAIASLSDEKTAQNHAAMFSFTKSVDALRIATDAYGAHMRGELSEIAAG